MFRRFFAQKFSFLTIYFQSPCESFPCQHGGTCQALYETDQYICTCGTNFTGKSCEIPMYQNCKELYEKSWYRENKAYPLKEGSVYCHLNNDIGTCGDGGWTLVMKMDGSKVIPNIARCYSFEAYCKVTVLRKIVKNISHRTKVVQGHSICMEIFANNNHVSFSIFQSEPFITVPACGATSTRSTLQEERPGLTHKKPSYRLTRTHRSPRSVLV